MSDREKRLEVVLEKIAAGKISDVPNKELYDLLKPDVSGAIKGAVEKVSEAQQSLMKHVYQTYENMGGVGATINTEIAEMCDKAPQGPLNTPMCNAARDVVKARK